LIPDDTQPDEIEERLTLDDWLKDVLEVPPPPEPVLGLTMPISPEVQPHLEEPIEEDVISLPVEVEVEDIMTPEVQPPSFESVEGDILLLPTDVEGEDTIAAEEQSPAVEIAEEDVLPLPIEPEEEDIETLDSQPPPVEPRERGLSTLPLEALIEGVDLLMRDQGYPDMEVIEELEEGGGEWIAHRVRDDEIESVYVQFYRMERKVDIRKARAVLKALETHSDCQLAYLVTTSDFSRSCIKLAKESEGKLVLITGDELSEYVHFEHFDAAGSYDGPGNE